MGQRLNIEIVKNGKVLANSYYHWSGYSSCAAQLTKKIIENYDYIYSRFSSPDILFAIKLLEETGAGLEDEDKIYAKELFGDIHFSDCKGRNEGLIAITEKNIKETEDWEEARVSIDIEKKTFDFDRAVRNIDEDLMQELLDDNEKFYETNINLKNVEFDKIFGLVAFLEEACYKKQYYFKNNYDNTNFYLIE